MSVTGWYFVVCVVVAIAIWRFVYDGDEDFGAIVASAMMSLLWPGVSLVLLCAGVWWLGGRLRHPAEKTVVGFTEDRWECQRAECTQQNPQRAAYCARCGQRRRAR